MTFRNNNRHYLRKIIIRNLKVNQQRNVFAVLGIMLTSILLSGVMVIGSSLVESARLSMVGMTMQLSGSVSSEVLVPVIGCIILIVTSGYLLIYNIFYIAIIKDIKFYGMLKTVGMTKSQIKKIILAQGLLLSMIGIPVGLLGGYGIGRILVPRMMAVSNIDLSYFVVVSDYRIFLIATLFALVTVYLSCIKPARMAGRVSPIEALRYTGVKTSRKKGIKHSKQGMKMYRMAYMNIFRSRKRGILVLASMSTSIILFLLIVKFMDSFSVDAYMNSHIQGEYVVAHEDYFDHNTRVGEGVSAGIYEKLKGNSDIQTVNPVHYYYTKTKTYNPDSLKGIIDEAISLEESSWVIDELRQIETLKVQLFGLPDSSLKQVKNQKVVEGAIDMDKLAAGGHILVRQNIPFYEVGEQVEIEVAQNTYRTFEVMAIVDYYYATDIGYSNPTGIKAFVPNNVYKKHIADGMMMQAQVNPVPGQEVKVEAYLNTLLAESGFTYKSREDALGEFESFVAMIRMAGLSLSGTIGMIALLNLFNTMLTSIIVRRQEFAMLQSVGMTKKQLMKMLIYEGMWYSVMTMLIVTVIGIPFIKHAIVTFSRETFFIFYNPNMLPTAMIYMSVLGICVLVPWMCYRVVGKGSVIERLRALEV